MLYRDADTGLILRKSSGLLLCNSCCSSPIEFSLDYCWCFLNPSPTAWNNYTPYNQYACVSYGGVNWFSKVNDNTNHAPADGSYWKRYYDIPPAWDQYATYRAYSRVSYGGKIYIWYRIGSGNSIPGIPDSSWIEFEPCNNSEWNSITPFGGPDKTPKYYLLTERRDAELTHPFDPVIYTTYAATIYKYIHTTKYDNGGDLPEPGICRYKRDSLISEDRPVAAGWPYGSAGSGGKTGTQVAGQDVFDLMTFLKSTMIDYCSGNFNSVVKGTSAGQAYDNRTWLGDNGTLKGTCSYDNDQWGTGTGYKFTVSWRPLDCNYTQWNTSSNYNVDACVTHHGKFYKCCLNNGPGTAAGVQEPPVSVSIMCEGTNYWRIV